MEEIGKDGKPKVTASFTSLSQTPYSLVFVLTVPFVCHFLSFLIILVTFHLPCRAFDEFGFDSSPAVWAWPTYNGFSAELKRKREK